MQGSIGGARDTADDEFVAAFDDLYPKAVRVAMRIVGNQAAAEDVAAEALARAYARWPRVGGLPYRDAWVMRVAGNLAIDVTRRRRPEPELTTAHVFEEAATVRVALAAALSQLPRRQREAIILRYLGGYSEHEVSIALGVSSNTVKTHLQRGLAFLRTRLRDVEGSPVVVL